MKCAATNFRVPAAFVMVVVTALFFEMPLVWVAAVLVKAVFPTLVVLLCVIFLVHVKVVAALTALAVWTVCGQ
jgi:hypothetical protein